MCNRGPSSICALRLRKSPELLSKQDDNPLWTRDLISPASLTAQPRRIRGNIRRDGLFGRITRGARALQRSTRCSVDTL